MSTRDVSGLIQGAPDSNSEQISPELRQRELNDNLAILRILDDPPYDEFSPFASEPVAGTNKQKRQTFFNFLAFCLAESRHEPVAVATTIYACQPRQGGHYSNELVLFIAGIKDRLRAHYLFSLTRRAWRSPNPIIHHESIMLYTMQLTEHRLKRRLEKLQSVVRELADFSYAVDQWGRQESSPSVRSWGGEKDTPSDCLKACFEELRIYARTHNFDEPHLRTDPHARIRMYQQWLTPAVTLTTTQFLCEMDTYNWNLPPKLLRSLRLLRRRCFKIRWYDLGATLLCCFARDCVWRILGYPSYNDFLGGDEDDFSSGFFRVVFIEPPEPPPNPMPRLYPTVQDMVQDILHNIDETDGSDEQPQQPQQQPDNEQQLYACDITGNPMHKHTGRQHVHLTIMPSCSSSIISCNEGYVHHQLLLEVLNLLAEYANGMLDTQDLEVPSDWLIPPTETGSIVVEFIRDRAARLILEEETLQRLAWEKEFEAENQMQIGYDEDIQQQQHITTTDHLQQPINRVI
ncbi:hypothetical protein Clacol_009028 [Clathrus columnatus]|uniref:Uncharacterized protein n=1 Tax=Clathrus columnatus TaxID=1419009 RepID=A0AAV5AK43_9AGAM|nr:hypothetical protein Clacol_009028 [Clathrus columnatus]